LVFLVVSSLLSSSFFLFSPIRATCPVHFIRVQVMRLLVMQFSSSPCYFIPLRFKYALSLLNTLNYMDSHFQLHQICLLSVRVPCPPSREWNMMRCQQQSQDVYCWCPFCFGVIFAAGREVTVLRCTAQYWRNKESGTLERWLTYGRSVWRNCVFVTGFTRCIERTVSCPDIMMSTQSMNLLKTVAGMLKVRWKQKLFSRVLVNYHCTQSQKLISVKCRLFHNTIIRWKTANTKWGYYLNLSSNRSSLQAHSYESIKTRVQSCTPFRVIS
jgi:hypothetical protein